MFSGKFNSFRTDGSQPSLPQYSRNQAYTWQRLTSWILLAGIIAHVIHMRFIEYPASAEMDGQQFYMIPVSRDDGLYTLSKRLDFQLYDQAKIKDFKSKLPAKSAEFAKTAEEMINEQKLDQDYNFANALEKQPLKNSQILIVSPSFGVAELLMVRDTFKSPLMIFLYTGLVLAACFHAFNGLWTSMISWGITLTEASQRLMRRITVTFMVIVTFLGLAAIWGTYWFNLYH